ncbi:TPA: type II toxin-antitoxin system RelE/ParE family toxin [Candidatus Woesearchaeota archaeon]|nr:type II toxin-antitoxin system RelE/ParE family toxin [Candidatus Woesearchaeota archaeon]HII69131.1 type II toxin-antitoxin system RelE/ParE family toxin [Candidatus Woesearchaeota archaeon]
MYTLEFTPHAFKQFERLLRQAQERISATLQRITFRPFPHVKRLVGGPYFKLRVGDYRVIHDIRGRQLVIMVVKVGHRKNVNKD